jgi:DNA polymerase III subunit epsilon
LRYLFLDTETTGLLENSLMPIERQPHIIELFMVIFDEDENEIDSWHGLFKPPVKLEDEIIKITGIREDDLVGQPTFASRIGEVMAFMAQSDACVAHNMSYDKQMMEYEFARAGGSITFGELICTVEATEHIKGFRLKLSDLYEYLFGEKFEGAHRAEADVRAMAKCFFEAQRKGMI